MYSTRLLTPLFAAFLAACAITPTAPTADASPSAAAGYDAALAEKLGADEYGMRSYVLVILKSGPTPVQEPDVRMQVFAGHMANIQRLAKEGKLVLAGPFEKDEHDFRGLFVFATGDVEVARSWVATDPAVAAGELTAEYHRWYGTAALPMVVELSGRIAARQP